MKFSPDIGCLRDQSRSAHSEGLWAGSQCIWLMLMLPLACPAGLSRGLSRVAAAAALRVGPIGVDQPMSSIKRAAVTSALRDSPCGQPHKGVFNAS